MISSRDGDELHYAADGLHVTFQRVRGSILAQPVAMVAATSVAVVAAIVLDNPTALLFAAVPCILSVVLCLVIAAWAFVRRNQHLLAWERTEELRAKTDDVATKSGRGQVD